MANYADAPIGVHQSSALKWTRIIVTSLGLTIALRAFYFSDKVSFWIVIAVSLTFLSIILFNNAFTSNISLTTNGITVNNIFFSKTYSYNMYRNISSVFPGYSKIYLGTNTYFFRKRVNTLDFATTFETLENHEQILDYIKNQHQE
ncbi:hypothetical protein [Hymenobacter wooponensis]|uniref:PH domain-containing protein n=1 Tax=Hymenobacter wooponensis TaxID=1525360 RepID=A0A4Z0MHK6_9BACT|nr:hypothetical protein [Hymenobacter wooponensis]TGD78959.1 hypothetical protein EU557_18480 [Hymenobacter wooponensis]